MSVCDIGFEKACASAHFGGQCAGTGGRYKADVGKASLYSALGKRLFWDFALVQHFPQQTQK